MWDKCYYLLLTRRSVCHLRLVKLTSPRCLSSIVIFPHARYERGWMKLLPLTWSPPSCSSASCSMPLGAPLYLVTTAFFTM
ncbi:hypothetical protein ARMSODRAFT_1084275 [Armillaria solidipes]|uniref:Uncharacterized protein n=1 Tax=Armillaria solidipes TaxID=1076256 RepID=A0A2H3BHA8_9AGAR|nr:hypothetical protein ARMSODRAFT_1084275 [Armillaria solidipes]